MRADTQEEWRTVGDHEAYEVSNLGRVRSIPRTVDVTRGKYTHPVHFKGKVLKATLDPQGRYCVYLSKGGVQWTHRVATLVAKAFIGPRPVGKEVCHKDDNKEDNSLSNLYWGTRRENFDDAIRNGVMPRGERSGTGKLTERQARFIKDTAGVKGCGCTTLAMVFNVSKGTIMAIRNNKRWNRTLEGK